MFLINVPPIRIPDIDPTAPRAMANAHKVDILSWSQYNPINFQSHGNDYGSRHGWRVNVTFTGGWQRGSGTYTSSQETRPSGDNRFKICVCQKRFTVALCPYRLYRPQSAHRLWHIGFPMRVCWRCSITYEHRNDARECRIVSVLLQPPVIRKALQCPGYREIV